MKLKESVSVFFPAYNDAESIGLLVDDAFSVLKELTDDYEVIVVNDGSPDNTAQVLEALSKKYALLKVVTHPVNRGYGGALKSGFAAATKDLIFYTDGDGQYDVKEIKKLVPLIHDADIVNGWKMKRSDEFYRKVLGTAYQWFVRLMFNLKIKDVDCDFRLLRKKVRDSINLESDTGLICVELVKKIQDKKFRISQVGVNHYPRKYGRSQFFRFSKVFKTLKGLGVLWFKMVVLKNE